ncbi:MAG: hypothetical protein GVY29_09980 [Spirochaetes bacterium]|nr:hypothetical protein [Spirochaetota bacterium]
MSDYHADSLIRSQGERYDELLILLRGEAAEEFRTHDRRTMRVETLCAPEALEKLLRDIAHRTEFLATKLRVVQFQMLEDHCLPVQHGRSVHTLDPERLGSPAEAAE